MNMTCPRCSGEGMIRETDIMRAKTVTVQCPDCRGTGKKGGEVPDGVYVKPEPGVLHYWFKYVGGRRVAHVQSIIEKVQPPQGKFVKPQPYFVVSIINMKTRNKDRKKGYCGEIIESIKKWHNSSVKFILTSWDDSNENSRAYLIKRGFVRQNSILIWRRPDGEQKTNGGSSGSPGNAEPGGDNTGSAANGQTNNVELGNNPEVAGLSPEACAGGSAIS